MDIDEAKSHHTFWQFINCLSKRIIKDKNNYDMSIILKSVKIFHLCPPDIL